MRAMAVANRPGLFTPKPTDTLVAEAQERGQSLKRVVGLLDLSALGLGAIIGTGIFVILGEAIGTTGPAIILAFVLAGLTCAFSALSYAEMASTIPVAARAFHRAPDVGGRGVTPTSGGSLRGRRCRRSVRG